MKRFFKNNSHNWLFKLIGDVGMNFYRLYENRNHDVHSNGELTTVRKLSINDPKIVFDGGANIGKYSLLLSKYFTNSTIYAFEPVKNTFEKLQKNCSTSKKILPINKGLFSSKCSKEINLFDSDTHSSIYELKGMNYSHSDSTTIELIKGDDFCSENKIETIDFLKLDLEGAEYDALLGFEKMLKKGAIKVIQFEYGYINVSSKKLLIDFYELLQKYNYKIGKIYPKFVEFRDYKFKHENFIGPNFLAVHNSQKETIKLLSK